MANRITTEEELADAIKNGEDTIIIEGDLKNGVIKIKATGRAVWGVCLIALGTIVAGTVITIGTGGATAPVAAISGLATGSVITSILGLAAATSLVRIAIAGRGIGVAKKLRKYKLVDHGDYIELHKN